MKKNMKRILKTLEKLEPRFHIPRQEGDDDYANPTLTELSPLYIGLLKRVNASPGLVFGYSQFRKIEGVELFKEYWKQTDGVIIMRLLLKFVRMAIQVLM